MFKKPAGLYGAKKALRSLKRQRRIAGALEKVVFPGSAMLGFGTIFFDRPEPLIVSAASLLAAKKIKVSFLKKAVGRPALAKRLAQIAKSKPEKELFSGFALLGPLPEAYRARIWRSLDTASGIKSVFSKKTTIERNCTFFLREVFNAWTRYRLRKNRGLAKIARLLLVEFKKAGVNEFLALDLLLSKLPNFESSEDVADFLKRRKSALAFDFSEDWPIKRIIFTRNNGAWQIARLDRESNL